jgi:hypothetical protein
LALIHEHLQLFYVALWHDPGISTLQLALHIQFVLGLLMRALRFLDLGFRLGDVGFRGHHGGIDFSNLAFGRFKRRLLFRAIQPEDHVSLGDRRTEADVDFRHTPRRLGKNRHRSEEQRGGAGRGMEIEDHRYQRDRQHQTSRDAPSELIPDRIERDLLAEPLVLDIAAVEIIGEDRHKGAND